VFLILTKFRCIEGCSDCCINREYFPSIKYGKIGVLLLPEEKLGMEIQAKKMGIRLRILPRLGVGMNKHGNGPKRVIAYQMMGKNLDGSLCPFLDTKSSQRSPHGGYTCQIYEKRPLACCAYPIIAVNNVSTTLDGKCQFCKKNFSINSEKPGLLQEIRALKKISAEFFVDEKTQVWRYATAIGDEKDKTKFLPEGWMPEEV
jgi:uncharacterized protein